MPKFCLILLLTLSLNTYAQTSLITNIEPADGGSSPPPTAYQINEITIDFDGLKHVPESLRIDFPDTTFTIVPITNFIPRSGFTVRTDDDPPGTPLVYPTPGVPNDELDYLWMGSNADYDVMLSVTKGQLTGLITGNEKRYGIEKTNINTYNIIDVRLEGYPPSDIEENDNGQTFRQPHATNNGTFISHHKEFDVFNHLYDQTTSSFTPIDVLIFWTEQARIDAGGDPNDPDDTNEIEALMIASVDHTNVALENSLTNTRVYKLHTAKLHNFQLTGNARNDRNSFQSNLYVNVFRNIVGADTVTLMLEDPSISFRYCGIAYVQTYPQCDNVPQAGCDDGEDFANYAFNMVSQHCAILDDTFTHELGHLFGGNHADIRTGGNSQLPDGWADEVIGNGYPDAFAELVDGTFASIMSIDFDTPRRLYFSNPNVSVNGVPTGEINTKNNAKIVDDLSPTMSNFRTRMDYIFGNGFEQ